MSRVENVCIASFGGDEILVCALERPTIQRETMIDAVQALQAHLTATLPRSVSFSAARAWVEADAVNGALWADMLHRVDLDLVRRKLDTSRGDMQAPFLAYLETVRA